MLKLTKLLMTLGFTLVSSVSPCALADATARSWVATISVQKYEHLSEAMQLQFCDNDARHFADRMRVNRQLTKEQVIEFHGDQLFDKYRPTKDSIERELPKFLARPNPEDTVFVFISMHGLQIPELVEEGGSGTYLLPSDFDPNEPQQTTIDIQWLRDVLQAGRAKTTVLILDACHSGGIYKTEEFTAARHQQLSIKSVRSVFQASDEQAERRGVYVLSSCGPAESSVEVPYLQHGVFTYWLLCGLDGAADMDHDTKITMDELFRFVEQHVPKTAAYFRSPAGKPYPQHPERFFCGTDHGNVIISQLKSTSVAQALQSLSELVDGVLRPHVRGMVSSGPIRVGIVEFAMLNQSGSSQWRGELGSFGRIARGELQKRLVNLSGKGEEPAYRLVPYELLELRLKGIDIATLNAGELTENTNSEVDALLLGHFSRRGEAQNVDDPDRLQLELNLLDVRNNYTVAHISKTILINDELWSLLNVSLDRRQQSIQTRPTSGSFASANQASLVSLHRQTTQTLFAADSSHGGSSSSMTWTPQEPTVQHRIQHPIRDAGDKTIDLKVFQGLPGTVPTLAEWLPPDPSHPNLLGFRTAKGMELTLNLTNNTDDWLAYIIQIDGLNQIGRSTLLPSESPYWLAPPRSVAIVDQWLDMPSHQGHSPESPTRQVAGTRLLVTSPPQSIAAQNKLTEQLGEIRVLVFRTKKKVLGQRGEQDSQPTLGIGEGRARQNVFPVYHDRTIDREDQEATYIIHYAELGSYVSAR